MRNKNFSEKHQRMVLAGQLWDDQHGTVRVMAVAEGYVMARRPHCMPFIVSVNDMDTWTPTSALS